MTIAELQDQLGGIYGTDSVPYGYNAQQYGGLSSTGYDLWAQQAGGSYLNPTTIAQNWMNQFDITSSDEFPLSAEDLGQNINPVTYKELMAARYGSMRPGIGRGIGSITGELIAKLGNIRTGGFESSGFVDKQKQAARDVFGKKASDILLSEGLKRSDYMGSLLDRATAEKELFSTWSSLGGD